MPMGWMAVGTVCCEGLLWVYGRVWGVEGVLWDGLAQLSASCKGHHQPLDPPVAKCLFYEAEASRLSHAIHPSATQARA